MVLCFVRSPPPPQLLESLQERGGGGFSPLSLLPVLDPPCAPKPAKAILNPRY